MNHTHEVLALKRRVEQQSEQIARLEQKLEEMTASLMAHGAATICLTHVLLARAVLEATSYREALADISQSSESEMATLPIAGPHSEQIRQFAMGIVNGSLDSISAAAEEYDRAGRPINVETCGRPN